MTSAEKEVGALIRKWRDILGINPRWEFMITVYETEEDTPRKKRHLAAWIDNRGPYLRSYLGVNVWQPEVQEDLETVITHELLHLLMDRIDVALRESLGKKFEKTYEEMLESVVCSLEQAFLAVRPKKK